MNIIDVRSILDANNDDSKIGFAFDGSCDFITVERGYVCINTDSCPSDGESMTLCQVTDFANFIKACNMAIALYNSGKAK